MRKKERKKKWKWDDGERPVNALMGFHKFTNQLIFKSQSGQVFPLSHTEITFYSF